MAESSSNPAFAAAVAEIDRQIEELQRAKAILLGRGAGIASDTESTSNVVQGDALTVVREQEFAGMTPAKATRALLLRLGRHEKTPTIIAAIRKGGVAVRAKNPIATMYTTLKRHSGFVALGKNYWDLAERRPDLVHGKDMRKVKKVTSKRGAKKQDLRALTMGPTRAKKESGEGGS